MLQILAHRGIWKSSRPNSLEALELALAAGYGIETDVRDRDGKLVISHDPATADAFPFEDVLEIYGRYGKSQMLALNVKSDGINTLLKECLQGHGVSNYFAFDMSVPQLIGYQRDGLITYTRHSDFEPEPVCYEKSHGVWMDAFDRNWFDDQVLISHHRRAKALAIVSPEIHHRDHAPMWQMYRSLLQREPSISLFLCTDLPEEAEDFFNAAH